MTQLARDRNDIRSHYPTLSTYVGGTIPATLQALDYIREQRARGRLLYRLAQLPPRPRPRGRGWRNG